MCLDHNDKVLAAWELFSGVETEGHLGTAD